MSAMCSMCSTLGTHLLRCSHGGERIAAHDALRDVIYYIIRDAGCAVVREKTRFLPSSILGGRGGRVDLVISKPARGHTLLDVVISDPTRVDLVIRAVVVSQHAASEVARQKERHHKGPRGATFIPIAIETYNALSSQTDEFLCDCAR